jgi:hypothetical protein
MFNTGIGWSRSCKVVERMENKTPEKWVVSSRQQQASNAHLTWRATDLTTPAVENTSKC